MNELITLITPNYNGGKYIDECIESCLAQTYQNFEMIIVDDASTDNSLEILRKRLGNPKIKLISKSENRGMAACRNIAIRESRGGFIVPIDSDDMLTPDSLEIRLELFREFPYLDMVHGVANRYYSPDDIRGWNRFSVIHAQGVMLRRRVFKKHGLYYEQLASKADKELWYRWGVHNESPMPKILRKMKLKVPVALYRKHDDQMHKVIRNDSEKNRVEKRTFKNRIKQLVKEGITRKNTIFMDGK